MPQAWSAADGPAVRACEDEFASACGVDHGVATANGTAALHAALHACGIGEGDIVVTTPFSFVATANAVRFCGAQPVFADIDPVTYNIDPDCVRTVIEEKGDIDAILPVHLYGLPADMEALAEIANEHDAALIEDAAQAHGAHYRGDPVGSLGDAAAFSFYPTKNMTTGEGGIVVTDDPDIARRAARFVNHGRDEDGEHVDVGHNFRMTSVAGAIGRVQLSRLDGFVRERRANAALLTEALAGTPVTTPTELDGRKHAFHQYTVRCDDRDALAVHLKEAGIEAGVYYPDPIHELPAYNDVDASCPVAERPAREVLSLPVHPALTDTQLTALSKRLTSY
jgi:dTDP-4-amino-4,6-dideoxygalactose transaminase